MRAACVRWLGVLLFASCLAALAPRASACPGCKEALLDPQQAATQARAAKGYAISIAALLGTPVLLVGGIAAMVVRSSRRLKP